MFQFAYLVIGMISSVLASECRRIHADEAEFLDTFLFCMHLVTDFSIRITLVLHNQSEMSLLGLSFCRSATPVYLLGYGLLGRI